MNRRYLQIRLFSFFFLAVSGWAQAVHPASSGLSLEQVAARAGLIFSGTVQDVRAEGDSVNRVMFKVDEGIRGVHTGEIVTIREWVGAVRIGLANRYRAGEKVLVFFHASGPNGLTSPVGGSAGVVRFADSETLKLTEEQSHAVALSPRLRAFAASPAGQNSSTTLPAPEFIRALRLVSSQQ
jgi:hypothetical protein